MKHKQKLRLKIILMLMTAIVGTFIWFYSGRSFLLYFLIAFVAGYIFSCFGTIGTHRWLSHRSFEPSRIGKILIMFGQIVESYGKPSQMVITHRLHHTYADNDGDPHSPKHKSFFQQWSGNFSTIHSLPPLRDFLRIKEIQWFDKHYWKIWWAFNLLLAAVDWQIALIFCPVTFSRSWIMSTVVNYHGHGGKKLEYTNLNPVLVFLTGGEGLHKNHHENPGNWRFSKENGPIDPGAVLLKYFLMKK